jgi:hypothetical protein
LLVYGDHSQSEDPRERLRSIAERLARVPGMRPGIERHGEIVAALIEAGQLQQGVEDAGAPAMALKALSYGLAACVIRSWDSGFANTGDLPVPPHFELRRRVEVRLPEGFAFYNVYPEAYADAARKLRLSAPARVIGIRSIGTTLGAIVAAALGAPPPETVRPFGDPFSRQVELPAEIVAGDVHYVIVDEGPGLSGSSFGGVADWLQTRGVPLERIAFIPSHTGDLGPHASAAHRARWHQAQRVAAQFDPAFLVSMFAPIEPFAIGGPFERCKYIGRADGVRVLLKFAGLGQIGERKLQMARGLYAAGFTPEPLGLVHGFIVERWCEDAQPLASADTPIEEIGRYIGARASLFAAGDTGGATMHELVTMCRRNILLALGEAAASTVDCCDAEELSRRVRRVRTDNKVDRSEWLRLADGRLLKTDALDHHQGHDLIGCQGIEWDIAGAIEEFGLDASQSARLIESSGLSVDRELLQFYRVAYAAFRLGRAELGGEPPAARRYAASLQLLLHQDSCTANRQESLVD